MDFVTGFLVWIAFGLIAPFLVRTLYGAEGTTGRVTFTFGLFGAFIGGMLGTSPYIFHDPTPLRVGALLGALIGASFFSFLYHFIARNAV
jgi:uncharacterized membrane protein YeaQ/YmgE (transglycosylase-associated protein family)